MANTAAVATSFKVEILTGTHAFGAAPIRGATTADTFKMALYLASATYNASTTAYSATGECSGTGYTAGGNTLTNAVAPTSSGTTAYWTPSANTSWTTVTLSTSFDAALLYNSTQSNKAVAVFVFGATTVTAANFTLTMPTNNSTDALIRIA